MRTITSFLSLSFLLLIAACTTVDAERNLMQAGIADAERLSTEITSWRNSVRSTSSSQNAEAVVTTVEAFKARAEETSDALTDLSREATSGKDLTGVTQALNTIADFDCSTYAAASPTARVALLDQLAGLSSNLQTSVMHSR